jgi:hypothetical protein
METSQPELADRVIRHLQAHLKGLMAALAVARPIPAVAVAAVLAKLVAMARQPLGEMAVMERPHQLLEHQ